MSFREQRQYVNTVSMFILLLSRTVLKMNETVISKKLKKFSEMPDSELVSTTKNTVE